MIVYEFKTLNFNAADGDTRFIVLDGQLELKAEPTPRMEALIEQHGGVLLEKTKRTKKLSVKTEN